MIKLHKGDTVGLISCCDGISNHNKKYIEEIEKILNDIGLNVKYAKTIYMAKGPFAGTGKERANELMKLFKDQNIKAIFDVSGGASSNQILGYLDYEIIKKNTKPYFGMSGLSVLLNTLYKCTDIKTYHYKVANLIEECSKEQIRMFKETFLNGKDEIYKINFEWIQGNAMSGIVIGGNMKALSKIVGTKYMPDFQDKILLLESLGGAPNLIGSMLFQLEHVGAFDKIKGIILGEFTEMQEEAYVPDLMELVREVLGDRNIPIVKTDDIGHSPSSKCIVIGKAIHLKK
ncbi:S66 peptidase family protein [uncultured Clostridium sp.]|uniref:S66 peptidase family protein n=1 Tax=uncultured Clostridium sp. TaxID=59620 RepID=UPI003216A6DB